MLDNVYCLLKERRIKQSEQKLLLGPMWKPAPKLENLVITTETDFEYIPLHGLRHMFATRCIEDGMEPQVLKAIMGHSKLSITMDLYAHVLPDAKLKEIQKISELFQMKMV